MAAEPMGTDSALKYARLTRDLTPEPCNRQQWLAWINDPNHPEALAHARLEQWEARVEFTGVGTGRNRPKFMVLVDHPEHAGGRWEFDTFEQARGALGRALEQCRDAEMDLAEAEATSSPPVQRTPVHGLGPAVKGPGRTFLLFWQG